MLDTGLGLRPRFVVEKPLYVFWGESPEDLLLGLEFGDFIIVPSPTEVCVNTRQPGVDRDRSNAPFPKGHDPLVDGLFRGQGTIELLEGLVVPLESLGRYVFDPSPFLDEVRDRRYFLAVLFASC